MTAPAPPGARRRPSLHPRRLGNAAILSVVSPLERGLARSTTPAHQSRRGATAPALGIVLAAYDAHRTLRAVRELVEPATAVLSRTRVVIVANSDSALDALAGSRFHVLRGTNAVGEFSAYQEGVSHLADLGQLPDAVLLANDRAVSYGDRYRGVLDGSSLEALCAYKVIVGSVESYHRSVALRADVLSTWCRTNFLLTSAATLAGIGPIVSLSPHEFDKHVPLPFPGPTWTPAPWLGAEYSLNVLAWLTRTGNWYRAEPLNEANWPAMRFKLLAVINEHLLSLRALQVGVALVGYKQFAQLKRIGVSPTLEWSIRQYLSHPFLGDDRDRTPPFRLLQLGAVLAASLGSEVPASSLIRRSIAQHGRDLARSERDRRAP